MTKQEFLDHVQALYRVANLSDSDSPQRESWTHPSMAQETCGALSKLLHYLNDIGVLSSVEHQEFFDTL